MSLANQEKEQAEFLQAATALMRLPSKSLRDDGNKWGRLDLADWANGRGPLCRKDGWHQVEKLWEVASAWFGQEQAASARWVESQK